MTTAILTAVRYEGVLSNTSYSDIVFPKVPFNRPNTTLFSP